MRCAVGQGVVLSQVEAAHQQGSSIGSAQGTSEAVSGRKADDVDDSTAGTQSQAIGRTRIGHPDAALGVERATIEASVSSADRWCRWRIGQTPDGALSKRA